jgi:SAM-dependent methyltransferase
MSGLRLFFGVVIFLAAFLLFLVEPIAAKQLLPVLGGSAAVWITCLVFFQTALLLGYLYAHWLSGRPNSRVHIVLLVLSTCAAIAWAIPGRISGNLGAPPALTVFLALSQWIGLPFLALSATSPLLQVWWARLETGAIPYRLYSLSNLASLLALALYPSLVEPDLTLHAQRFVWSAGFLVFAFISIGLTLKSRAQASAAAPAALQNESEAPPAPLAHKLLWVLLPMGAAMQLSTVTAYLTANVAAIPLLWILPLGVYLLTLILAFQFRLALPWNIIARIMVVLLGALAYSLHNTNAGWPLWISLIFFLGELFFACIFCHVEAVRLRPQRSSEATLFYLLFAAGGALGSFLIGIAAPLVSTYNLDLPVTFFVTAVLALAVNWRNGWNQRLLWGVASVAMIVVTFMVRYSYAHNATVAVRNFYASLRVTQDLFSYPGSTVRTLMNGSIQHGTQIFGTDELRHTPTTYYARNSGIGLALDYCCLRSSSAGPAEGGVGRTAGARNIGVIGLGAGTIAAYGRPGDHIRFYDINPDVPPIARNVFTYIRDSPAQIDIIEGDARTSLASEPPQEFDVLAVDAFSGDAIPIHLLTSEAVALYRKHLRPGGILAFHISNRHVDLGPPIALLAQSAGMEGRRVSVDTPSDPGEYVSTWMLLTADPAFFDLPDVAPHARPVQPKPGLRVWTDDYSALLPFIRW